MLRTLDWRGRSLDAPSLRPDIPRVELDSAEGDDTVLSLVQDVKDRGARALIDQASQFDGCEPADLRETPLTPAEVDQILSGELREAIEEAIARVRVGSLAQVPPQTTVEVASGASIVQRWVPVDRAGVYVPGGKAVYPSSVVMNVVAAQTAGVGSIALASPPQHDHDGHVHPVIRATAALLGVEEVYAMGGAGAIAALAYGVPDVGLEPVAVITGPGNRFVAGAKRLLKGQVGIDSEAGPTEIAIIADESAPADLLAADLVSQAEHDELAQAILITTSQALAEEVVQLVAKRAATTLHRERVETSLAGHQSAVILVDSVDDALAVSDVLAPEHLEIMTADGDAVASRVRHAGAVFVGPYTPVSAGDYLAGSNHVLPTGGKATFQAGLSAMTFLRPQQLVHYTDAALTEIAPLVEVFAEAENLPAHAEAIRARRSDGSDQ